MTLFISEKYFDIFKGDNGHYYIRGKKGQRLVSAEKKEEVIRREHFERSDFFYDHPFLRRRRDR
jgi:hypothetical protein